MDISCLCGHQGKIEVPLKQGVYCGNCKETLIHTDFVDYGYFPEPKEVIKTAVITESVFGKTIQEDEILSELFAQWLARDRKYYEKSWGVSELTRLITSLFWDSHPSLNVELNSWGGLRAFCGYLSSHKIELEFYPEQYVKLQLGQATHNHIAKMLIESGYGGHAEVEGFGSYTSIHPETEEERTIKTHYHIDWTNNERMAEIKTSRWRWWMAGWELIKPENVFTIERLRDEGNFPRVLTKSTGRGKSRIVDKYPVGIGDFHIWVQSSLYGYFRNINPVDILIVDILSGKIETTSFQWHPETVEGWLDSVMWNPNYDLTLPKLPLPKERPRRWELAFAGFNGNRYGFDWKWHGGFWCGSCPKHVKGTYDENGDLVVGLPQDFCPKYAKMPKKQRVKYR